MPTAGVPLWSTTAADNATADPAVNWAEGQAPSTVNNSGRGVMASVAKWRNDLYGITTGGTSTAYTVATGSTFASASDMSGVIFCIVPNATSGAAPTLAVDGLTARAINISTGVAVPTGALVSGTPYLVKYVHASTEFILVGPLGKSLLTSVDIAGGTSLTAPAVGDLLPIYDLDGTANKQITLENMFKVIDGLTADGTPAASTDYVATYDASASGPKKVLLQNLPSRLPRGYIDGCILSNNGSDATNDIDISAGVCRDSTNAVDITVAASTKQLDANWAAGTTGGMRNSAAGITDATYHIYAVATAAGVSDIYAHTSTVIATVLAALQAETGGASYIYARRIRSIVREGAAIRPEFQHGDTITLKTAAVFNDTNDHSSEQNGVLAVPLGLELEAMLDISCQGSAPGQSVTVRSPLGTAGGLTAYSPSSGNRGSTCGSIVVNTSGQVKYQASNSAVDSRITLISYNDQRGKDA